MKNQLLKPRLTKVFSFLSLLGATSGSWTAAHAQPAPDESLPPPKFLGARAAAADSPAEPLARDKNGFGSESEARLALTGGNAVSRAVDLNEKAMYRQGVNTGRLNAKLSYAETRDSVAARSSEALLRYDRALSESSGAYAATGFESNVFSGFKSRWNEEAGGRHEFYSADDGNELFAGELGYRFTRENRVAGSDPLHLNRHFGRAYLEYKHPVLANGAVGLWVEALQDIQHSDATRVSFEPSLTAFMNQHLALKVGYLGKYDRQPVPGKKKFDFEYTTSLIAKF